MYTPAIILFTIPLFFSHIFARAGIVFWSSSFERVKVYLFLILVVIALCELVLFYSERAREILSPTIFSIFPPSHFSTIFIFCFLWREFLALIAGEASWIYLVSRTPHIRWHSEFLECSRASSHDHRIARRSIARRILRTPRVYGHITPIIWNWTNDLGALTYDIDSRESELCRRISPHAYTTPHISAEPWAICPRGCYSIRHDHYWELYRYCSHARIFSVSDESEILLWKSISFHYWSSSDESPYIS